jgi:hypothetical protein
MSKEAIEKLAKEYLERQSNTFSESWRRELVKRVLISQGKRVASFKDMTDEQRAEVERAWEICVAITHEKMFLNLPRSAETWLRGKYRILNNADVEEIVGAAFDNWRKHFDPERNKNRTNPELGFLIYLTRHEAADHIKKHYPRIHVDNKGVTHAVNVPLDVVYDLCDPTDYSDNDETRKDSEAEREDLDKKFIDNKEIFSRPVKFGWEYFPYFSFAEIFKYYSLTQKLVYAGGGNKIEARVVHVDGKPAYTEIFQPKIKSGRQSDDESLSNINEEPTTGSRPFEMLSVNNTTTYYRRRWEILRSIGVRRRA